MEILVFFLQTFLGIMSHILYEKRAFCDSVQMDGPIRQNMSAWDLHRPLDRVKEKKKDTNLPSEV